MGLVRGRVGSFVERTAARVVEGGIHSGERLERKRRGGTSPRMKKNEKKRKKKEVVNAGGEEAVPLPFNFPSSGCAELSLPVRRATPVARFSR